MSFFKERESKMSDEQARFLFSAARIRATRMRPYFAACLLSLLPIRKGIGTVGVDEFGRIYYDPDKLEEWGTEKSAAVLIHECCHILKFHAQRAKLQGINQTTGDTWNIACDMAINDDLIAENLPLPERCWTPKKASEKYEMDIPDWRSEEEYYYLIKEKHEEGQYIICFDPDCPQRKSNQKPGSGGEGNKAGKGPKHIHGTLHGSGTNGIRAEWEEEGIGSGDSKGLSQSELRAIQRQVAHAIQDHIKNRGTVPGDWERWAEDVIGSRVRWETELRVSLRQLIANRSGLVDFTLSKMSRRQSSFPKIVLPALRRPTPKVVVITDTSGSMDDHALGRAICETKAILKSTGAVNDTIVLSVDAEVHNAKKVVKSSQIQLLGGGGTDMRVGFQYIRDKKLRPNVVVVFTDGMTPWPLDVFPWKTIVILIGKETAMDTIPKTFKVVHVRD
jgi:predicted metal-dependent peptidase